MNVGEILDYINEIAPWKYAEGWDNVGLMVGSSNCKVKKIMLCMDVTSEVIDDAINQGSNVIISHHPFLFSKLDKIDLDTLNGHLISKVIKRDICVISAHTNLDVAVGGVEDTLAEALGLTNCRIQKSYIPEGLDLDIGMGKVGELPVELCFEEFIRTVKKNLGIDNLRIVGVQPEYVKKVDVFCGSFDGDLDSVKRHNVDVLVTGDIKYHIALEAREMGLCLLDVGHFASEHLIVDKLKKFFTNKFNNIEIICNTLEKDPFVFS
ncbi:MAG TPA: Nif3-like dinuclear metal center hexameric protein [Ruminiclostridium sp.]